ncbi:bifunctional DNA primase/polymerase [Rhizobium leguminosarum]|uniref:bifunctional DNA primase/polymerase n=1 Tax=Rhizobium leguminosarum TaxID=384 RepID=UPI001A934960|nr:bifunctional DNA primase/polymerase [Rhizobium leguminosarum]MBY5553737.1 DUF3987 domain-containing protein [Rhizobium leguminosarum]QSW24850.1 bifunctional DNA primase/polymerase [Rhizobium leguminosarum]
MTKSPKDLALSYAGAGVPCFPCRSADEVTDRYDPETGEFEVLKAKTPLVSSGFKGASKNLRVTGILWDRNPTAMVGIPTGEQLGAWVLDVDVHKDEGGNIINGYETLAALEDKHGPLPMTATARTAGGGEHRYFKYAPGVRNRGKLGHGLDVRGIGGYVIAPGSVTAEGKEYVWLDYDGEGLPPLADAPDWLLKLVLPPPTTHVPSNYSYQSGSNDAYVDRAIQLELEETASVPMGGGRNNRLNQAAFSLGTLVGAGALAETEARALLQDVARGWGRDWAQCCKTIDNGLDAGMKQPRAIPESSFLDDGTTPVDTSLLVANKLAKKSPPAETVAELPEPPAETLAAAEDEPPEYKLQAVADLESLTYPGGLLEDIIDWIVSSAEQPCRALAMAAVLPFVSSLCGSRYSTTNRDTRPNIYTVAIADSGFGKEHARSQIKRLLMSDHGVFEKYGGPARIMSASALREVLEASQSVNCQIDEFGGFVREITDRKAGSHQRAISTDLRDYYSASTTYFEGAAYRGSPPKRIYNPNLCIHGTSTPEQFWSALSSSSAEDGLLARIILFHVTGKKPAAVTPQRDVRFVPHTLLMRMADVAGIDVAKKRGNLAKSGYKVETSSEEVKPIVVPWSEDALGILRAVKETIEDMESNVASESQPFVKRIIENAIKLALIAAVGTDPKQPIITEAIFEWAAAVAWTCAAAMLSEVGERLADNQREANYKKIAALIRKAGAKGITEGRLADRCKAIDGWQRKEILDDLSKTGQVELAVSNSAGGRPARRLVWVP